MKKGYFSFANLWDTKMHRIMSVLFLLVLLLNFMTPYISDDFLYSIHNGFLDLFKREYIQYMTWTGRSVAHIIDRILLALPKIIFDVLNSLCFVYLTHLVYVHVKGNQEKEDVSLYVLLVSLIFLCVPFFGQTVLWQTGACNYLWMSVIVLVYLKQFRWKEKANPIWMFVFGIVAGWTNENTAGALILLLLYFVIRYKDLRNGAHYLGIVGVCIGFVMMILAPGNAVRGADFVETNGRVYEFLHDFVGFLSVLKEGQGFLLFIIACGFGYAFYLGKKEKCLDACAYLVAGIAAVFAVILSPVPVLFDRSMFGSTIFLIIAFGILFESIQKEELMKQIKVLLLSGLLLVSGYHYVRAVPDLFYTKYLDSKREKYVLAQKEVGNLNPIVPQIHHEFETTYNPIYGLSDLSIYRKQWMNESYSTIHGIESIQSTPMAKWNTIYKDGDAKLLNITNYEDYLYTIASREDTLIFINSNRLDTKQYQDYLPLLSIFGENKVVTEDYVYLNGIVENGMIKESLYSLEPCEKVETIQGHYCYLSSQLDPTHSDILIDNVEYTNDNAGINIVVFDKKLARVVDSITFTTESDQGGIRFFIEQ
ncbi:MAG: hypothetical protein J6D29_06765 [Solobacterium sp.]|nr:hypothetical protein [Solobacterium sp.]